MFTLAPVFLPRPPRVGSTLSPGGRIIVIEFITFDRVIEDPGGSAGSPVCGLNHPGGVIQAACRVDTVPLGIRTPRDC
jgi:hypothetical protein